MLLQNALTGPRKLAFETYLDEVYKRLLAHKRGEPTPATYAPAMTSLATLGLDLQEWTMWRDASVDVLSVGSDDRWVYQGVLLRDETGHELLIFSGDVQADFLRALLSCFGEYEIGASCWVVAGRSGHRVIVAEDPVFGSVLAYAEGYDSSSHRSVAPEALGYHLPDAAGETGQEAGL